MRSRRNIFLGVGLIALALLVLFHQSLPDLGLPLWPLVLAAVFFLYGGSHLLKRNWRGIYIGLVGGLVILNNAFHWLGLEPWVPVWAAILIFLGLQMLLSTKSGENGGVHLDGDTVFSRDVRHIQGAFEDLAVDTVFSSNTFYFEGAVIAGEQATFSGDTVFSSLKLFVPQDWQVTFAGDKVFSSVKTFGHPQDASKELLVTGDLVFSSLEIHYR